MEAFSASSHPCCQTVVSRKETSGTKDIIQNSAITLHALTTLHSGRPQVLLHVWREPISVERHSFHKAHKQSSSPQALSMLALLDAIIAHHSCHSEMMVISLPPLSVFVLGLFTFVLGRQNFVEKAESCEIVCSAQNGIA